MAERPLVMSSELELPFSLLLRSTADAVRQTVKAPGRLTPSFQRTAVAPLHSDHQLNLAHVPDHEQIPCPQRWCRFISTILQLHGS